VEKRATVAFLTAVIAVDEHVCLQRAWERALGV